MSADITTEAPPPFSLHGPSDARTPLVIAVPHAGRHYPDAIKAARAVPLHVLEDLEDRAADLLIADAVAGGAVAVVASFARAWIDLNRGEADGANDPPSARARAGLGLIPQRLGGRQLWRSEPTAAEAAERLATVHAPYHAAIVAALEAAMARHGFAVLLDCHSMPPLGRVGGAAARVVLGDRHGTSAAVAVTRAAVEAARGRGVPVALNAPYAGAYTLERHGRPNAGRHALQIEIDRSLYLDPAGRQPSAGLAAMRRLVAAVGWAAVDIGGSPALNQAAE